MVSVRNDPMSPERGQYGFLQDLVKRVAYDMLARKDRRLRHLAAAATSRWSMATTMRTSSRSLPPTGSMPTRQPPSPPPSKKMDRRRGAVTSRRASWPWANNTAERSFAHAASLADEPMRRAELLERAGMMAAAAIDPVQAGEYYAEAEELFRVAGRAIRLPACRRGRRKACGTSDG